MLLRLLLQSAKPFQGQETSDKHHLPLSAAAMANDSSIYWMLLRLLLQSAQAIPQTRSFQRLTNEVTSVRIENHSVTQ